jgi:hypothetical protein
MRQGAQVTPACWIQAKAVQISCDGLSTTVGCEKYRYNMNVRVVTVAGRKLNGRALLEAQSIVQEVNTFAGPLPCLQGPDTGPNKLCGLSSRCFSRLHNNLHTNRQDSSAGIVTGHGLHDRRLNCWQGQESTPALGLSQSHIQTARGLFPWE